jgi:hypothetical protein
MVNFRSYDVMDNECEARRKACLNPQPASTASVNRTIIVSSNILVGDSEVVYR